MKLHQSQTEINCGIDLHTTSMYICVMNRIGEILLHKRVAHNNLYYLEKLLRPYMGNLTVGCESTLNWFFLCDFCDHLRIPFVLGHSLYMRSISQAKVKNDKVDSQRLADLLRTNLFPESYVCPHEYRYARDLLRKRGNLVRKRTDLKNSLTVSTYMHGFTPPTKTEKASREKRREAYTDRAIEPLTLECYKAYLDIIDCFDDKIRGFERILERHVREQQPEQISALTSAPALGPITALTIIYESGDIHRFRNVDHYCSYARVACNEGESNGKATGSRGRKMGNKYLKWAYEQLAVNAPTYSKSIRTYRDCLRSKHDKSNARNKIAHRLARFAYFSLKDGRRFDLKEFFKGKESMIKED